MTRDESLRIASVLDTHRDKSFLSLEQMETLITMRDRCGEEVCSLESADELTLYISRCSQSSVSCRIGDSRREIITSLLRRIGVAWRGVVGGTVLTQDEVAEILFAISDASSCAEIQ